MEKEARNGMTFKFVTNDAGGTLQKRQQSARACDSCRRRKKRCHHGIGSTPRSTPTAPTAENAQSSRDTQSPSSPTTASAASHTARFDEERSEEPRQIHSQGDNSTQDEPSGAAPEQHLESHVTTTINYSRIDPYQEAPQESRHSRFIGDLNPEAIFLAATSPDATRGTSLEDSIGVWLNTNLSQKALQGNQPAPHPQSSLFHGSSSLIQKLLVPMLEQECLSTIPTPSRCEALSKLYFDKVHPMFPVVDQYTYNSRDPKSPESIILRQGICLAASKNVSAGHLLILNESEPPLTCRQFGDRISAVMRMSIEMGLVSNKVVVIQALALLSQFTDSPTGEDVSSQLCGRAVHHLQSLGLHVKGQLEETRAQESTTLLCCIWAIDRLNAAINGRPVWMHERDIRKDLEDCFQQQQPCFRLFLEIIMLLDKVIDLYRPMANSGESQSLGWEFPAFEDVVMKCGGSQIGTSALATVEILYHAIAILSSRSRTWADPQRSSTSYLRQTLSTSILSSTIWRELQDQLTIFPFVPYALSLSMSMAYREMRHSKLPLYRARSRAQFQTMCDALSSLEGIFWSASTTSEMGKKLLKEMDRVFTVVSSSENRRPGCTTAGNIPVNGYAYQNAPSNMQDINESTAVHAGSHQTSGIQDFDPSIFDNLADIDLFGMFDPAFDLDGLDACLEGNLNPAFPTSFQ